MGRGAERFCFELEGIAASLPRSTLRASVAIVSRTHEFDRLSKKRHCDGSLGSRYCVRMV